MFGLKVRHGQRVDDAFSQFVNDGVKDELSSKHISNSRVQTNVPRHLGLSPPVKSGQFGEQERRSSPLRNAYEVVAFHIFEVSRRTVQFYIN